MPSPFSASTWRRSTCARTRTCMSAPWRNCWRWHAPAPTTWRWTKRRASTCCWKSSRRRGRWRRPASTIRRRPADELAIFHTARDIHQRYGKGAIENVIISKADGVSDILEVAVLLKEVGPAAPARARARRQYRAAVRNHRRPRQCRPDHGPPARHPALQPAARLAPGLAGSACSAIPTATRTAAS